MNYSSAFALNALFEAETRSDPAAVQAVLDSFEGGERQRLVRYLNDPIGVRQWVLNERSFFAGERFPVVSRRAMLRLREARVAAAYGLLDAAVATIDMSLLMTSERRREVHHALGVYAAGVRAAFPDEPAVSEQAVEDKPQTDTVGEVGEPAVLDVVAEPAKKRKKTAKAPAKPAKAKPRKPKR
jgi:hypothetical protein